MPPAVELLADSALVAIMSGDGEVRGTGFVIHEDGTVLTCHHVVDGLALIRLRGPGGSIQEAEGAAVIAAPDIDLALICVSSPFGAPLPVVSDAKATTEYWTKGYHRLGESIRAAFPVQGRIIGRTSVSYRTDTSSYDIPDVFVLRDDSIDPGLSGAPVLDPEVGVVVAVVSTKLVRNKEDGGFAVPIARAAAHRKLAKVVAHNQATIPVFGTYLNAPAARALCKDVTDSEIDNLAQLRSVDLSRRVPRSEVEAGIRRFLSSDVSIFALVGPSGVGKSTEVAAIAQQLPGRALLLRGSSLHRESTGGVSEAIRAALARAGGNRSLPDNPDEAIARALSPDSGLIVLLDAFNEAPFSGRAFEEWIANTRSWLRNKPARLIVSCRSELWRDLVGPPLSAKLDGREPVVIPLGTFSKKEYREAAQAYGLSVSIDWPILRLPLALRLCARHQQGPSQSLDAIMSINDVIEAYVEDVARNLAVSGTRPPLSAQVMRNRLVETAALMLERGTDVVDMPALGEIFGTTITADALLSEGVMSSTPSGYRFVYDDVSDWLQAQRLDLESELRALTHGRGSSWRRIGPVASALRDVARREGAEALNARLLRLLENVGALDILTFQLIEEVLVKVADARPYGVVLSRMADVTVAALRSGIQLSSTGFWRSVPVPVPDRLELLRHLISFESDYPWRSKDWSRWDGRSPEDMSVYGNSAAAFHLIEREPELGIPALRSWLDDNTLLEGGEATVADVAMGILYQFRRRQEREVWSVMAKAGDRCGLLINGLAGDDPQWLARMVVAEGGNGSVDNFVVYVAYMLRDASLPSELTEAVYREVAERFVSGLPPGPRGWALNVLAKSPASRQYAQELILAYKNCVPGVNEWSLETAAAHGSSDIVLPVLVAALNQENERRKEALLSMAHSNDLIVQSVGDKAVRRHLEKESGVVDYAVSRYAEERLWRSEFAGEDLLAVVRKVIAAPSESFRRILIYPLTDSHGLRDKTQCAMLLRELIEARDDDAALDQAARRLIYEVINGSSIPDAFALLQLTLTRLKPYAADYALFDEAAGNIRVASKLARWLTTGELIPPSSYAREFVARIESGLSLESAAKKTLEDIRSRRHGDQ
jgi:hypothetical protein